MHLERFEKANIESKKKLNELDDKISKLLEAKTSQDALEKFAISFKNTLDNLSLEQKRIIVDMLVDSIEVYKAESELRVDIFFRFAQSRIVDNDTKDEPKAGSNKTKNPLSGKFSVNLEVPPGVEPGYAALQADA